MVNARVYFLGTGAAMPIARSLPCIALKVDSEIYLFDPGEGCQAKMFKVGLSPLKVKAVFISHAHGDHYLGLPGLVQSMTLSNRREPLVVFAPKQLKEAFTLLLKNGFIRPCFKLDLLSIDENTVYTEFKVLVKPFPVDHGLESYGFSISIGKKTICYTGDTSPTRAVVDHCKGVDVLIHEATFTSLFESEAHEQKHSTALDAARIALECNAKILVLFHISARHSAEELFYDAYRYFKNTVVALDGMVLIL